VKAKKIAGKISGKAKHVQLEEIVGKTILGIGSTTVEGANGPEPCIMLYFTDGTSHGFVIPTDGARASKGPDRLRFRHYRRPIVPNEAVNLTVTKRQLELLIESVNDLIVGAPGDPTPQATELLALLQEALASKS
jgi:hypothetical protein